MGIYGWCRSQGEFTDVGKLVDLKDDERTIHTSNEHSFSRAPIGSRDMRNG